MKKLLAILLSLTLLFAAALPAFASEDLAEEPNPAMPIIYAWTDGARVHYGEAFELRVVANIPNGDAIGYRWYRYLQQEVGSKSVFRGTADESTAGYYYVEVYNQDNPEAPVVTSDHMLVEVLEKRTVWESTKSFIQSALGIIFFYCYMGLFFVIGILLAPFQLIRGLFN